MLIPHTATGQDARTLRPVPWLIWMPTMMAIQATTSRAVSRGRKRVFAPATFAITVLSLIAFSIPGLASLLQFDAQEVARGQWWRVITGHWTHYSLSHLFWDLSVFAVLGVLSETRDRWATWFTLAFSSLLIPLVSVQLSEVEVYRGLSGLDTGLFAYLAGSWLIGSLRQRDWMVGLLFGSLIVGMVGKITWEALGNGSLFVDVAGSGFTPVPLAHFVGALIGMVVAARKLRAKCRPANTPGFGGAA
jgi:rhomboid family GlyGly-CTERM serine protease